MKRDDSGLSSEELENVRLYSRKLLHKADAVGQFPTPVDHIVKTANLFVNNDISLGKDLSTVQRFSSNIAKLARPHLFEIKKLLGLLHVPSGEIIIDHSQHEKKKVFIKLHETGHSFLPHQRKMFEVMEDGQLELNPDTNDLFEREANNFASETLFQGDQYEKMAADYQLSIKTPIDLSKKFGSSTYSSMRRYVSTHFSPLALAVYDHRPAKNHDAPFLLRRGMIVSDTFITKFGPARMPNPCEKHSHLGEILSRAKLHTHHKCNTADLNGTLHNCSLHVFNNSYEIFVLLIPEKKIGRSDSQIAF